MWKPIEISTNTIIFMKGDDYQWLRHVCEMNIDIFTLNVWEVTKKGMKRFTIFNLRPEKFLSKYLLFLFSHPFVIINIIVAVV
jgi:hypothetical protein